MQTKGGKEWRQSLSEEDILKSGFDPEGRERDSRGLQAGQCYH